MFSASAELYDLIYSGFKDYPAEARELAALIRRSHPHGRTVLDVACGTGEHARLLTEEHGFDVDGLDLDSTFVAIAQHKLPRGIVYEADMTSFEIPRRYDVIVCLFSSIGYVRTLENVQRTFDRFRQHLADAGVVLVEPWFPPGMLQPDRVSIQTAESARVSVARMSKIDVEDRLSRLRFEYLIGRASAIEHVVETHELGLFTTEETLECFREAGLYPTYDPKGPSGRGLFLARAS
ncbi:MAG TPA: methyltransferase domain-containing protein [Gemmatimonadales bacterium]|nr:methyltransferase domain-containing protein [Gemmatimonadales bacterium]